MDTWAIVSFLFFSSQNLILMLEFCSLEPDATGASLLICVIINLEKITDVFDFHILHLQ